MKIGELSFNIGNLGTISMRELDISTAELKELLDTAKIISLIELKKTQEYYKERMPTLVIPELPKEDTDKSGGET